MRILHVIPFFGPRHGGAFTVPFEAAKKMKDMGHEVTIITSDFQFDEVLARSTEGIEILPFKTIFTLGSFYFTPSMRKWLDKNIERYEVIHVHSIRSYQNIIVNKSVIKRNKPCVIQAHGSLPTDIGSSTMKRIYDLLFRSLTVRAASAVIAVNARESCDYVSYGFDSKKVRFIYNGININKEQTTSPLINLRAEHHVDSKLPLIFFVGRLNKIKGTDIFVEALGRVHATGTEFAAFIIGPDYGLLDDLLAAVSKLKLDGKVVILGPLNSHQLMSVYSQADLVVIPSRYDAYPVVLLEASLAQAPVILSTKSLVADLFRDCCYLADPEPEEIFRAIIRVLSEPDRAHMRAQRARDLVINKFDLKQTIKDTIDLYSETLKEKSP